MAGTVHVVGAGLAGLAAAVRLAHAGVAVALHEAAPQAGGRCRSYHDPALGITIDNGNHLLLSANRAALGYVRTIGGQAALTVAPECAFPFADLATGARWTLRPGRGRLPFWIFSPGRRVPDTRPGDYLAPLGLFTAGPAATVAERLPPRGPLYERLLRPLLLAALNTEPEAASARLAGRLIAETLGKGGDACRPVIATGGLGAALVDPALADLARRGVHCRFGAALKAIETAGGRAGALQFAGETVPLAAGDAVILAVPPRVAGALLPGLVVPDDFRAILNVHFRTEGPPAAPPITGVLGGMTEWLFAFADRLSVTVSAADRLMDIPREELARTVWDEVSHITGGARPMPAWQVVRERRATIAATPGQEARRPGAATPLTNVYLAGDWTATGLPATIEGAVRSGERAAALLQGRPITTRDE